MSSAPRIKYEHSPADSLAESFSTPSTQYASLFDTTDTIDPIDIDTIDIMSPAMTPRSYEGDSMFGGSIRGESVLEDTPSTDKKPVKKRKSWGQQLPEPKTNLPPRKRAKTEDEKEQRRVERVLRNRRAAQSSRERKRQEVEALEAEKRDIERRNRDLEMQLAHMQAQNMKLQEELSNFTGSKPVAFAASPVSSSPHQEVHHADTPLTFSKPLFPPRAPENQHALSTQAISDLQAAVQTVNPASLSPEIRPVADASNACSPDMAQHPAEVLCDPQCQSGEQRPWMALPTATTLALYQTLIATTLISMTSQAILTLPTSLRQILTSLKTGSSLSPTPSAVNILTWLLTTTTPLTTSTSMTSSTTMTSLRPRCTLRTRMLRRLLACSPNLARPLMDATIGALRSASEQQQVHDCLSNVDASVRREDGNLPSVESLMTLLWTIHVIERERGLKTTQLDAAAEVRQACDELGKLFSPEKGCQHERNVSFLSDRLRQNGPPGKSSLAYGV